MDERRVANLFGSFEDLKNFMENWEETDTDDLKKLDLLFSIGDCIDELNAAKNDCVYEIVRNNLPEH